MLPTVVHSSGLDTLISGLIGETGIFDGSSGIIYCAEKNGCAAVITAEENEFVFTVYGPENEITDSLSFRLGGKNTYEISAAEFDGEFAAVFSTNGKTEYFRLINDAFTPTAEKPSDIVPAARYRRGKITVLTDTAVIYDTLNSIKLSEITNLRLDDAALSDAERSELLSLVKSCADLMHYDSETSDENELVRHVLFTHKNFKLLSSAPDNASDTGGGLKLCGGSFIDDVMQKAFRRTPEKPPVNMLTTLGYCYNNGCYYYTGGYNTFFSTDNITLVRVLSLSDTALYVIFSDTYTEGASDPIFEYSTAVVSRDEDGFYLTRLDMGGDIDVPRELMDIDQPKAKMDAGELYGMIFTSALLVIASAGVFIWLRLLRR